MRQIKQGQISRMHSLPCPQTPAFSPRGFFCCRLQKMGVIEHVSIANAILSKPGTVTYSVLELHDGGKVRSAFKDALLLLSLESQRRVCSTCTDKALLRCQVELRGFGDNTSYTILPKPIVKSPRPL